MYVPPQNSKYSSKEAFNEIENEYIDFSKNVEHSLLIGDYNAKTSDLNDLLIPNDNLLEILDIADDDELLKEFYDYENLLRCGVPLLRTLKINRDRTSLVVDYYEGLGFNFSFAELLPAAKIQFLIGDIGYLFSSDVGYFYDSLGKMFLKECFDLRHDLLNS